MNAIMDFLSTNRTIVVAVLFGLQGFALIMQGVYLIQFGKSLKKPKQLPQFNSYQHFL